MVWLKYGWDLSKPVWMSRIAWFVFTYAEKWSIFQLFLQNSAWIHWKKEQQNAVSKTASIEQNFGC